MSNLSEVKVGDILFVKRYSTSLSSRIHEPYVAYKVERLTSTQIVTRNGLREQRFRISDGRAIGDSVRYMSECFVPSDEQIVKLARARRAAAALRVIQSVAENKNKWNYDLLIAMQKAHDDFSHQPPQGEEHER